MVEFAKQFIKNLTDYFAMQRCEMIYLHKIVNCGIAFTPSTTSGKEGILSMSSRIKLFQYSVQHLVQVYSRQA